MYLTLYIFNRYGELVFYSERRRESARQHGENKLVAGMLIQLQHFMQQLAAPSASADAKFYAVRTSHYKLHAFEALTGYRFALLTDPHVTRQDGQKMLEEIYGKAFVEFVAKDPAYRHEKGQPQITSAPFQMALAELANTRDTNGVRR